MGCPLNIQKKNLTGMIPRFLVHTNSAIQSTGSIFLNGSPVFLCKLEIVLKMPYFQSCNFKDRKKLRHLEILILKDAFMSLVKIIRYYLEAVYEFSLLLFSTLIEISLDSFRPAVSYNSAFRKTCND